MPQFICDRTFGNLLSIELFEDLSQHLEQVNHQPFDGMQSAVETALRTCSKSFSYPRKGKRHKGI
jgi:hypothetical protein